MAGSCDVPAMRRGPWDLDGFRRVCRWTSRATRLCPAVSGRRASAQGCWHRRRDLPAHPDFLVDIFLALVTISNTWSVTFPPADPRRFAGRHGHRGCGSSASISASSLAMAPAVRVWRRRASMRCAVASFGLPPLPVPRVRCADDSCSSSEVSSDKFSCHQNQLQMET